MCHEINSAINENYQLIIDKNQWAIKSIQNYLATTTVLNFVVQLKHFPVTM